MTRAALIIAVLLFPSGLAAQALRIGVRADPRHPDLSSGARFGATEANYTARLLGFPSLLVLLDSAGVSTEPVAATLNGTGVIEFAGPPVLTLSAGAEPRASALPPNGSDDRRIVVWHASLDRYGAAQLNDRYRAWAGREMSADAWLGWFAVKILFEGGTRVGTDPAALRGWIADPARRFDGHKGAALRFDSTGRLVQPVYVIERRGNAWTIVRNLKP